MICYPISPTFHRCQSCINFPRFQIHANSPGENLGVKLLKKRIYFSEQVIMRWLKQYPWYTLLFAMYSPMALIAYNVGQVQFSAVLRSMLVILVAVFILTSLLIFLLHDPHKAGLIVTLVLVLFFSFWSCIRACRQDKYRRRSDWKTPLSVNLLWVDTVWWGLLDHKKQKLICAMVIGPHDDFHHRSGLPCIPVDCLPGQNTAIPIYGVCGARPGDYGSFKREFAGYLLHHIGHVRAYRCAQEIC